ncbi:MAG: rod shape-determining protein MreC [Ignavibacteria bacterium RBG_13_36_8]|nr:MAG: rod shape-determining protein MreC [Ignavibacteria bacterium RBG_13_36_8]
MQRFIIKFFNNFKEYLILVLLLIISLSFLSINDTPQIKNLKSFALGNFAFLSSMTTEIFDLFSSTDKIDELERLNAELMLQVNNLREYGLENPELRSLLSFKEKSNYPLLPSKIISKLVSNVQGNFIINVGQSDSVAVGMPVINARGLIGIIINVSQNFSVIRTLHNTSLSLAVLDQRSGINGILDWDGAKLIIKNIPTTYDVQIGDRIVTSEFSTIFPPSIPIGVVVDRETNISGLLNNITVESYVDLKSIKNVFVMKIVQSRQVNELELNLLK